MRFRLEFLGLGIALAVLGQMSFALTRVHASSLPGRWLVFAPMLVALLWLTAGAVRRMQRRWLAHHEARDAFATPAGVLAQRFVTATLTLAISFLALGLSAAARVAELAGQGAGLTLVLAPVAFVSLVAGVRVLGAFSHALRVGRYPELMSRMTEDLRQGIGAR
jgi:hypothetical protein